MPKVGSGRVTSGTGQITYTTATSSGSSTAAAAASTSSTSASSTTVTSVVGSNIGSGSGLYASSSNAPSVTLSFRSLIAGSGIVLAETADSITISCNVSGTSADGTSSSTSFTTLSDGPSAIVPNALVFGSDAAHLAFTPAPTMAGQTLVWTGSAFQWDAAGSGAVTSVGITTTTGLTASGSPITSSGTITLGLTASGVTPGTFTNSTLTIDQYGRVTAAVSNSAAGVSSVAITSDSNIIAVGGPITSTGTFALSLSHTGVTPGSYTFPTLAVDAYGRILSISSNTISTGVTSVGTASVVGSTLISNSSSASAIALKTIIGANAVTVTSTDTAITISTPAAVSSVGVTGGAGVSVVGNTITSTGTFAVSLSASGAVAGTYTAPTLTVDQYGRITAINSNSATVTSLTAGTGLLVSGSGATTVGLGLSGVSAGTYVTPTLVVDATGRVISAASNSVGSVTGVSVLGTGPITVSGSTISTSGTFSLGLAASGVAAGTYPLATVTVDSYGRVTAASAGSLGSSGTVQSVAASGDGNIAVTGGPITSSGTLAISLVRTGATAGTYANPTVTIDSYGRVLGIAAGAAAGVSSIAASGDGNIVVSGSPITSSGTLALSLASSGVTPGSYDNASVTVDTYGRVKAISAGTTGVTGVTLTGGTGIAVTGSTVTTTGTYTVGLSASGATAGTYVNSMLAVDQYGRITSISSASALSTGTFPNATVVVDANGRISAVSGTATSGTNGGTVTSVGATGDGAVVVTGSPITSAGTLALSLSPTGVSAGTYSYPTISVDAQGRVKTISTNTLPSSVSSVSVQAGTGISIAGSTVTSSGTFTVALAASGATAGSYSNPSVTVDATGRITAISSGAAAASTGGGGTVTSVAASGDGNITVIGSPITSTGTLALALAPTSVSAGTYVSPTFTVDSYGRVQSASSFAGATPGTYTNATVVVDQNGRVSSVTQGSATAGTTSSVTTSIQPYSMQVYFDSTGNLAATNTFANLPTGWTASRDGANQITITHNLARPPANIVFYGQKQTFFNMKYANGNQTSAFSVGFPSTSMTPNTFTVYAMSSSATDADASSYVFMYVLI